MPVACEEDDDAVIDASFREREEMLRDGRSGGIFIEEQANVPLGEPELLRQSLRNSLSIIPCISQGRSSLVLIDPNDQGVAVAIGGTEFQITHFHSPPAGSLITSVNPGCRKPRSSQRTCGVLLPMFRMAMASSWSALPRKAHDIHVEALAIHAELGRVSQVLHRHVEAKGEQRGVLAGLVERHAVR